MLLKRLHCFRRDNLDRLAHLCFELAYERPHQSRDIVKSISQWRYVDRKNVQSVIQVFAKFAVSYALIELMVCSRNNAHIDLFRLRISQALELAVL